MATMETSGGFLSVAGNGPAGSAPISGQDELVSFRNSEVMTISTAGATTDSTEYLLPANSIIDIVTATVLTAIAGGGASSFGAGDSNVAARFMTGIALTAGTTAVGVTHQLANTTAANAGPGNASALKVRITVAGGTPTSGVVRITVFGRTGRPAAQ